MKVAAKGDDLSGDPMQLRKYLLTIRIPFGSQDDTTARPKAVKALERLGLRAIRRLFPGVSVKLQYLPERGEPRKVRMPEPSTDPE